MTKQEVIDFLTCDFALANLPDSFVKLRQIANDPHSDIDDVVEVAREDCELAASLLKLANSPFYNKGSDSVATIEEAAQRIGLRKVVESSLALGIIKKIDIQHDRFDLGSFWRRSLTVAKVAEEIFDTGPRFLRSLVDRKLLYTAGLLHDIGMLAQIQGFTDEMLVAIDNAIRDAVPIQELEESAFGFSHQDVGRILFKKWGLPDELQCVAGYHHTPLKLKRRLYYPLVDIVYIADYICGICGEESATAFRPTLYEEVWERCGLSLSLVDAFAERVEEYSESANAILTC